MYIYINCSSERFLHDFVDQELPKEIYTDAIGRLGFKFRNSIWVQTLALK